MALINIQIQVASNNVLGTKSYKSMTLGEKYDYIVLHAWSPKRIELEIKRASKAGRRNEVNMLRCALHDLYSRDEYGMAYNGCGYSKYYKG